MKLNKFIIKQGGIMPDYTGTTKTGKIISVKSIDPSDAAILFDDYIDGFIDNPTKDESGYRSKTAAEMIIPQSPALTAIKSVLAAEIAALNLKYTSLELTSTDTILSAIPKLLAVEALKSEVVYLKMLYDTVKEANV